MPSANDVEAVKHFFEQWKTFERFKALGGTSHAEVYALLHAFLGRHLHGPFSMLDLGCGDAASMPGALKETQVIEYHGLDLSHTALELAIQNMQAIPCRQLFLEGDYVNLLSLLDSQHDVIWASLTLHHLTLAEKQSFFRMCRNAMKDGGYFLVYDPVLKPQETRDEFTLRWEHALHDCCAELAPEDQAALLQHVRETDYPETLDTMRTLGLSNGFLEPQLLFEDRCGIYDLFCYRANDLDEVC